MQNLGKKFEQKLKEDILNIEGISIVRLQDQLTGWKNSSNISDFVVYKYPTLIYLEAKCRYGNTLNIDDITQYQKLLAHSNIKGVHPTVVVWFIDHDSVIAFPVLSIKQMKENGLKSINIKTYRNYPHIDIPSIKKRIFMDSDYKIMFDKYKEEDFNG